MKTATINTRIDPNLKEQAEQVLQRLGVSTSGAITMFYQQIVLQQGIPFPVKLPPKLPILDDLSPEELATEIQKGLDDAAAGQTIPADEAFQELERKFGI